MCEECGATVIDIKAPLCGLSCLKSTMFGKSCGWQRTFLVTQLLEHVSSSVAGPRLLTVGFAGVLVSAVFLMAYRLGGASFPASHFLPTLPKISPAREDVRPTGLLCGVIASVLLIGSPGFLELSSSCMLEIPSVAPGVAALCVLYSGWGRKCYLETIAAGVLFGISLRMKLIGVVLLLDSGFWILDFGVWTLDFGNCCGFCYLLLRVRPQF